MSFMEVEESDSDAEENRADLESLPELLPNRSRSSEQQNSECQDLCADKVWGGQWLSLSKESPYYSMQSCDSPLASDSSSSLSTRDSSLFSWSEGSHNTGTHVLHSPELLSKRFSGFSLFNSAVNRTEWACSESSSKLSASEVDRQKGCALQKDGKANQFSELGQRIGNANMEGWHCSHGCDRCGTSKTYQSTGSAYHLDGSWVRKMSGSGTVASSLSQEPRLSNYADEDDSIGGDRLCGEHHSLVLTCSLCTESCRNSVQVATGQSVLDFANGPARIVSDMNWNGRTSETCNGMPRAYDGRDATTDSLGDCSFGSCFLNRENRDSMFAAEGPGLPSVMVVENSFTAASRYACCDDECQKVYGILGVGKSAKVDCVARHPLPSFLENSIPKFALPGGDRRPLIGEKAGYSAIANESFVSSSMHGRLRFAEQGGSLSYTFFLDGSDEVLFARASKQERESNKENSEWVYSFHSKNDEGKAWRAWKSRPKRENLVSKVIANMRVSSICRRNTRGNADACNKESLFVLYGGGEKNQVEGQRSGSENKMRGKPLMPVFDNALGSQLGLAKEGSQSDLLSPDTGNLKNICLHNENINRYNGAEAGKEGSRFEEWRESKLHPIHFQQTELAAIIINTSLKDRKTREGKEMQVPQRERTGWGMKFLEKGTQRGWGLSFMERPVSDSRGSESITLQRTFDTHARQDCFVDDLSSTALFGSAQAMQSKEQGNNECPDIIQKPAKKMSARKKRLKVEVTVILPAGDHGLPDLDAPGSCGPTPLLQRWMAGGDCDCGGWDMGCGLSVFKAETLSFGRRISSVSLTRNDCMNWLSRESSFKLLTQGYKRKKVLVLEIIEAGLFMVSFQPSVSPLQAFATAVALFHQQMIR